MVEKLTLEHELADNLAKSIMTLVYCECSKKFKCRRCIALQPWKEARTLSRTGKRNIMEPGTDGQPKVL